MLERQVIKTLEREKLHGYYITYEIPVTMIETEESPNYYKKIKLSVYFYLNIFQTLSIYICLSFKNQ